MSLFSELKERKLVQWTLAYLAAAWVLLQVLQFVAQSFAWPPQILRVSTILAIAGFIIVLIVAWNHGERGRQGMSLGELMLVAAVLIAGSSVAWLMRGESARSEAGPVRAERNSIAVLPFSDMSEGGDTEYFSDGVTEEILNVLAKTPGLRVAARTSSFSFKGKDVPIDEVAQRLRVAHVLEGSVRRAGDRVRITAQLIDAANGYHLWSETYDRELKDIFALQDEISRAIVDKLKLQLTARGEHGTTSNTEAYELYLRGRFQFAKRTPAALQLADSLFGQSIKADPNFAPAHAGLAAVSLVLPLYTDLKVEDVQPRVRAAALRALELDSTLADAWAALAYMRMSYEHDWEAAEEAFQKAEQLNPNNTTIQTWFGDFEGGRGDIPAALRHYERLVQLDPMSAQPHWSLGWMLMAANRLDESARELERAIELDPNLVDAYTGLARVKLYQGKHDEAIAGLEDAVDRSKRRSYEVGLLGNAYALVGRTAEAQKILTELQTRRRTTYVSHLTDAFVYIGLKDFDRAFGAIEQARKDGDMWLTENNVDLVFTPLRSDPRWAALIRRMGIS